MIARTSIYTILYGTVLYCTVPALYIILTVVNNDEINYAIIVLLRNN